MQGLKQGVPLMLFFILVAGLAGEGPFLQAALTHGLPPFLAILTGITAGNIVTPLLLPWIPGKPFSVKGATSGLFVFLILFVLSGVYGMGYLQMEQLSWLLITLAVSSWLGMAFTGASTYTSLNGVRKEMLWAMPAQFVGIVAGIGLWGTSLWLG